MSYILEALSKSEHARKQGRVPDLATAPVGAVIRDDGAASRHTTYALAAAALALVAAVLGWWRPWQVTAARPGDGPTTTVTAPQPEQWSPSIHPDQPAALRPTPSAAIVRPGPASTRAPAESGPLTKGGSPVPPATRDIAARGAPQPSPPDSKRSPTLPAEKAATHVPGTAAGAMKDDATEPATGRSVAVGALPRTEGAPRGDVVSTAPVTPTNRILSYQELPTSIRSRLPALTVSGHSYAEGTENRMAVVNDRLVVEGDEVAPGVAVVRIGHDGLVLSFEGFRFRP